MRLLAALAISVGLYAAGHTCAHAANAKSAKSLVVVLVDLSATWHTEGSNPVNTRILSLVGKDIVRSSRRMGSPILVRYQPIADFSANRWPLCEAMYSPSLFAASRGSQSDSAIRTKEGLLDYLVDDCVRLVLAQRPMMNTDIVGALKAVEMIAAHSGFSNRNVILLSDMVDDVPPEIVRPDVNLRGFTVVVVYRTLDKDLRDPRKLQDRIKQWEQSFLKAGAQNSVFIAEQALHEGQLAPLLQQARR